MADPDLGKVDHAFFAEQIAPHLGAERDDVALGPTHGVDFGVIDVDGTALVTATDPVSILPALGWERAGTFALDIVLADVAVSGIAPSHLAIGFTLPPGMTDEAFADVWTGIHEEAADLGVSVVTGHTARYADCSFPWVGAATAMAVGEHDDVIRPDGAQPGDCVLVTRGPAVEATGLLTTLFPTAFEDLGLPAETIATAQERLDEATCVRDAVAAAEAGRSSADPDGGVTAMHDATEGGLRGALCEVAESADVHIDLDADAVPLRPGVREVCDALGIDPWAATTSGTLVLTARPKAVDDVVATLADRGTPVGVAGTVSEGEGVAVDGEPVDHPRIDPSWEAYERLAARSR